MTRRNLSDILRQEVKKETPDTSEPESKPAAVETAAAADPSRARRSTAVASSADSAQVKDASEAKFTAQITELTAALAQGAEHEKTLQAEIKSLQADVKRQQKEAGGLESQVSRLKAELTEAKSVILQLSEENTQMRKTVDESKASKAQPQRKSPLSLRSHSVQPRSQTSGTNNPKSVDVGWMD
jgi:septal ring factor EnvC (AmiA/AmiB activator)